MCKDGHGFVGATCLHFVVVYLVLFAFATTQQRPFGRSALISLSGRQGLFDPSLALAVVFRRNEPRLWRFYEVCDLKVVHGRRVHFVVSAKGPKGLT